MEKASVLFTLSAANSNVPKTLPEIAGGVPGMKWVPSTILCLCSVGVTLTLVIDRYPTEFQHIWAAFESLAANPVTIINAKKANIVFFISIPP